jgi:hypothetical protein
MFRRLHSAVFFSLAFSSVAAAQITVRKVPPPTVSAALEEDRVDLMDVASPPGSLTGNAMGAKLAELGLRPDAVMEGETLKLTVVSPRHSVGNLGLVDVGVTSAGAGTGWASVRGSAIARFKAEAGSKYLIDFSVGDLPGTSTSGTRHFTARIYPDGSTATVQEFTVPKGPQHILLMVDAKGPNPSVVLTLTKDPAAPKGGLMTTATLSGVAPQFIFYSAEISKLK